MKLAPNQLWKHKNNAAIDLFIIRAVYGKYKVKISGPAKNMHQIEMVSSKYITSHYSYSKTIKENPKIEKEERNDS